jgi:hypothetical protein
MPNWCDNSMKLSHTDVDKVTALAEAMATVDNKGNSMAQPFQHLRPRPEEEQDWYNWSLSNWGTKWDANIIDWSHDDENTVTIYCDTAWGPPIALYDYLCENGWSVDAIYHEPGMCFAGMYSDGNDNYYEYDVTDPDFLNELPGDVIEFANLYDAHQGWIVRELESNWNDEERSDWHKAKSKPEVEGWYEVALKDWQHVQFMEFKDGEWDCYDPKTIAKWRGLAKSPEVLNETI